MSNDVYGVFSPEQLDKKQNKDKSKPAFPWPPANYGDTYDTGNTGMTLRELYAGLAMMGICSTVKADEPKDAGEVAFAIAENAVLCADALLEELAKCCL